MYFNSTFLHIDIKKCNWKHERINVIAQSSYYICSYSRSLAMSVCTVHMKIWVYTFESQMYLPAYIYHSIVFYSPGFYWTFIILNHSLVKSFIELDVYGFFILPLNFSCSKNTKSKKIYHKITHVPSSKFETFYKLARVKLLVPWAWDQLHIFFFLALSMW